ncbi:MAG: hypothetical protein LBV41_01810 [Cytophagaceae bacterium]|jgi:flagellar basal body-associated protein FliL|nr:hypothetical protein [Cytophagaceae bacterium]
MLGTNYPYEADSSIDGKRILTKGANVRIRSDCSASSSILQTVPVSGTAVGMSNGRVWYDVVNGKSTGYKWYEIDGKTKGFIRTDLATLTGKSVAEQRPVIKDADAEAQKELDAIVAQDKETMNNLNTAAAMIEKLKVKGQNTAKSAGILTAIMMRLQERQEAMKKNSSVKVKETNSDTGAWASVKKFFGFSGLGVIPIVVIIVVAVVAGAGTTALVLTKPWKNQSNIDLKESRELKTLLENADPVVAQKIREDIKTQLVDAYTTGNRQGSVSGFLSVGKYVLIAGAALWIAPKVMDYFDKAGRKTNKR